MDRNTNQRRAICRVLEEHGGPLGPSEIYAAAKHQAPGLGIATVYRTIRRLLDENYLATVELPGEAPRYELAGKDHHHHFRCRECHRVYDVNGCSDVFRSLLPKGFHLDGHELFLFGLCETCNVD